MGRLLKLHPKHYQLEDYDISSLSNRCSRMQMATPANDTRKREMLAMLNFKLKCNHVASTIPAKEEHNIRTHVKTSPFIFPLRTPAVVHKLRHITTSRDI